MQKVNVTDRVVQYILTRNDEELGQLTMAKVAVGLKISRSHMYDLFKNELKMTPAQFLTHVKILRAAIILEQEHDVSIKNISLRLGFSTSDYFRRVFKENLGTTPGRYRQYLATMRSAGSMRQL